MSEAILSKVRKLLAKAEDPACTPAESAAFTAKATELIARYGVDQALLAARDPAVDPVGDRVVDVPAPYARDKAGLLAAVAEPMRCRSVRRQQGSGFAMHLFGFASDLERVDLLFTSLLVQAAHGLAAAAVPPGEHPAAFRRSWLAGFAQVVTERLRTAEADAAAHGGAASSGPSYALVLADRSDRVRRRLAEVYPRLRTAPRRRLAGRGFGSGAEAGRRADLGGRRMPGHQEPRRLPPSG
ncbi:DUF2786 domain-containing protein [Micromonospora fluostatini]|uniref:DUF2786 domain-containing protein n=1 Tax=Micromonospora fluostatini TaxID=1629071 RepID=A0ABY2DHY0_9ACTN|nr:DUF2786 domain-containing protein [Micromonospora fluostatini]